MDNSEALQATVYLYIRMFKRFTITIKILKVYNLATGVMYIKDLLLLESSWLLALLYVSFSCSAFLTLNFHLLLMLVLRFGGSVYDHVLFYFRTFNSFSMASLHFSTSGRCIAVLYVVGSSFIIIIQHLHVINQSN